MSMEPTPTRPSLSKWGVVCTLLLVAGCGQTGPLYLPDVADEVVISGETAATDSQSASADDSPRPERV